MKILVTGGTTFVSRYVTQYFVDVSLQEELMPDTINLRDGLKEEFEWYKNNLDSVYNRKPYVQFIDEHLNR